MDFTKLDGAPLWEQLQMLEQVIMKGAPPISPPACHWLDRDATASYCHAHAWEARWRELPTVGECPPVPDWFRRSDLEQLMADGIDGCAGMGGESDHPESCETCGCTLEYLLTDHGQEEELAHFADNPVEVGDIIDGELSYALSRIFMNLDCPGADERKQSAAINLAKDVILAIMAHNDSTS